VLSNPQYFEYVDWEIEWIKLKEQVPADERVYFLANDWLYAVFGSNLEIGRTKNVLAESLRFWRTQHNQDGQFVEFLLELIRSGQFFSDELALSFLSLMAALDLMKRELSDEDYLAVLMQVIAQNYFSNSQTESLLDRIDEAAQPKRVLTSEFWPAYSSSPAGEFVILESWKDVAVNHQDFIRAVLNRVVLLDDRSPIALAFKKKWQPLVISEPKSADVDFGSQF
jgi:hypothetical protein